MPWLAVEKAYEFDGPEERASLLDLFDGRRQLILYRPSSSPECAAGLSTPVSAAPWWPIKWPTPPISTRATPRSRVRLAGATGRHRPHEGANGVAADP